MSNCSREAERGVLLLVVLMVAAGAAAGPYGELDVRLRGRPDAEAVAGLRRLARGDQEAADALWKGPEAARAYVALRATLEGGSPAKLPPIGAGPGDERIESSWLARALSRLRRPTFDLPRSNLPARPAFGAWATVLMWGVLASLGAFAVYLLVKYVRLPKGAKKRKALVEGDEPMRTADAWIEEADGLVAQGRFREAVRGLYVAGLLRYDEAGVARFDRNQTNWEHLRRIEASPARTRIDEARAATARFDRVWYGHREASADEARTMRAWYEDVVASLQEARPA